MYDVVLVPAPKYIPPKWKTVDLGEFVQYDPKYFKEVQIPEKQRMGLKCIRPKGEIPQPVGLTDYGFMFADTRLGSVDMTGWDFSQVRSIAGLCMNCKHITKIKCDGLDFRNCVDMHRAFYNCDGIKYINVETWLLDEISTAAEMFAECSKLIECIVGRWNTVKLDSIMAMYENCASLKRVDLSGWDTTDLNVANKLCKGCTSLEYANIRFENVKGLIDLDRAFLGCKHLKEVIMPDLSESPNCTLYLAFDGTPKSVRPPEYDAFMKKFEEMKNQRTGAWF